MMIPTNFVFFQLSIVALLLVTLTISTSVPQSIEEVSQSYANEQRSTPIRTDHHQTVDDVSSSSKHVVFNDDDENLSNSNSDEEYNNKHHHNEAMWQQVADKHYVNKVVRAGNSAINSGDNRLWAIPYRFGKRAAMPYRFGKRAAMPYRFGKRGAAMHFRLGKKSASL